MEELFILGIDETRSSEEKYDIVKCDCNRCIDYLRIYSRLHMKRGSINVMTINLLGLLISHYFTLIKLKVFIVAVIY